MKKLLYIIGALGLIVSSCTKADKGFENPNNDTAEVQFTANTATTRVTGELDNKWENLDEIGIFATNASINNANYRIELNNVEDGLLTYNKGSKIIKPDAGQSEDYYAYYPFSGNTGEYTDGIIPIDLTENQEPLLWANVENETQDDVTFTFQPKLAKLNFTFTAGGKDITTLSGVTATLKGANTKGKLNVKSGKLSYVTANDIPLAIASNDEVNTITAYVMPTNIINYTKIIITIGDKQFGWRPTTDKWEAGQIYDYNITVGELAVKVGDYYYGGGVFSTTKLADKTPIGIVFLVDPDDKTDGKAVSLDQEIQNWGHNSLTTNAQDHYNGLANTRTIKNINKDFSNYLAFAEVDSKNRNGTNDYADQSKDVWYLPSKEELEYPYSAYTGYGKEDFNLRITDSGGNNATQIVDDYHWSSTEWDDDIAYNWNFAGGNIFFSRTEKICTGIVRGILAV